MALARLVFCSFSCMLCISYTWAEGNRSQAPPAPVSMIQLIADPESHLNQVVKVSGWFNLYKLFATEEHYSMLDMSSSVDLAEPTVDGEMTESCESRYVTVTGTFLVEDFSYKKWPHSFEQLIRVL